MELHERAAIFLRERMGERGACLFDDLAELVLALKGRWPQYPRPKVCEIREQHKENGIK